MVDDQPADVTVGLTVNGERRQVTAAPDTPLLHVLRNVLGLRGSRFGCGVGLCGACFVLVDGKAVPSCDTPLWSGEGKTVVTVEGLSDGGTLHPAQQAVVAALDRNLCRCGVQRRMITAVVRAGRESAP